MKEQKALSIIILLAIVLFVTTLLVPFIPVPIPWLTFGRILSSAWFVSLPVFLLFYTNSLRWSSQSLVIFLIFGILCVLGASLFPFPKDTESEQMMKFDIAMRTAFSGLGTILWSGALGVFMAKLIKDKNLLIPVAFVLATVDIIVTMMPFGTVQQILRTPGGRMAFEALAYKVPEFGVATPAAFIGPADLLFLSMFFCVVHRFELNARATLFALVPALVLYLWVVLFWGGYTLWGIRLNTLPALVPISLSILLANIGNFKLNRNEKIMTFAVVIFCILALSLGFWFSLKK
ncbi:MAG TPA: hypothetical protein VNK96_01545 [Fimbriimonadales bacterium]|nr:hypothetical protein [Fimbriimonadales bacterium]